LRGVRYLTWSNKTKPQHKDDDPPPEIQGTHAKHTNYVFDPQEFLKIINVAIKHVREEFTKRGITTHDEF